MRDFLIDEDGKFQVANGDLVTGFSDIQHQRLLLETKKGDYKHKPSISVGAAGFLKDEDERGLLAEIKTRYEQDGAAVDLLKIESGELVIDAEYRSQNQ
jgi:hypothetical protein